MRENGYSLYTDAIIGRKYEYNPFLIPLYSVRMNDGRFQVEERTVLVSLRLLIVKVTP